MDGLCLKVLHLKATEKSCNTDDKIMEWAYKWDGLMLDIKSHFNRIERMEGRTMDSMLDGEDIVQYAQWRMSGASILD
jgi:hypothetical protein